VFVLVVWWGVVVAGAVVERCAVGIEVVRLAVAGEEEEDLPPLVNLMLCPCRQRYWR